MKKYLFISLLTIVFIAIVPHWNLQAEEKTPFHFAHRSGAHEFEDAINEGLDPLRGLSEELCANVPPKP